MKQDTLNKIDRYFELKKPSEVFIIFGGCALVIAYLAYMLCFDPSEIFYNEKLDAHNNVSAQLQNTQNYLDSVSSPDGDRNFAIARETKTLEDLKAKYNDVLKFNGYFDMKLKELSFLLFNDQNWANFLDSIVFLAKQNNIKILELKSDIKEPNYQKIEQILNVNVKFLGGFKNVISYINSLEESKLVVDLHKMDINSTQNELGANITISVWGMKY
ncbi:hypothetical protein [Campylobacter sp. FOBRC14]|uniref:hypothetical protein n=1 Tax=Campylobacter sp. FOBRC14 TaxID=936554 RepID=UPI00027A39DC|nr:hypothetical protein [Campylobacter sp. FOBRC14]EJP74484.1 pilus assembly protein, PilO [Campylobacter sp. FOBRC14]